MKTGIDLQSWPDIELDRTMPASQALQAGLVTETDLLRLKVIARLHARGLPPYVDWTDLLQEAFMRVLVGSRRKPPDLPIVPFLAGVMRSIKEQHWRQSRSRARHGPKLLAERDFPEADELVDPTPSPERKAIVAQEMESIGALFEDDLQARQVLQGLHDGQTPEETCNLYAMSRIDYESTRKRMRRALIRAGLRAPQP